MNKKAGVAIKSTLKSVRTQIYILISYILRPLFLLGILPKCVVVRIEGGLASQLEQYTLGQYISDLGYEVRYDLSFYEDGNNYDVAGKEIRTLSLQLLDTELELKEIKGLLLKLYKNFYELKLNKEQAKQVDSSYCFKMPVYLNGYGYSLYTEKGFEEAFCRHISVNYDRIAFGDKNTEILNQIEVNKSSIGLHVRRGDTLMPKVGRPIAYPQYYFKALSYFDSDIPVYIFSDDMKWVEEELLPLVLNNDRCVCVRNNDSEHGWCDMILLSACTYQIKSPSGGLARDAYRLNRNPDKKLVLPVFVPGNMANMQGNIIEIVLDDELCDLSYVRNRNTRL